MKKEARKACPGAEAAAHARGGFGWTGAAGAKSFAAAGVLKTLDNGAAIARERDIDIQLVARHFYYNAGWANC